MRTISYEIKEYEHHISLKKINNDAELFNLYHNFTIDMSKNLKVIESFDDIDPQDYDINNQIVREFKGKYDTLIDITKHAYDIKEYILIKKTYEDNILVKEEYKDRSKVITKKLSGYKVIRANLKMIVNQFCKNNMIETLEDDNHLFKHYSMKCLLLANIEENRTNLDHLYEKFYCLLEDLYPKYVLNNNYDLALDEFLRTKYKEINDLNDKFRYEFTLMKYKNGDEDIRIAKRKLKNLLNLFTGITFKKKKNKNKDK